MTAGYVGITFGGLGSDSLARLLRFGRGRNLRQLCGEVCRQGTTPRPAQEYFP